MLRIQKIHEFRNLARLQSNNCIIDTFFLLPLYLILFYLICPDARSFGASKLLTCLCSHAVPDGGLSALADTQAKYSSPSCILPTSVFLLKVNGTTILFPAVPSGSGAVACFLSISIILD